MLPSTTPAVEAAIAHVLSLEAVDGYEHLVALSPSGTIIYENSGTGVSVEIKDAIEKKLILPSGTIVHNHPDPVSLSLQDVRLAGKLGCDVWAVTSEGSRYWSSGAPVTSLGLVQIETVFRRIFISAALQQGWTEPMINTIGEHCRNVAMSSACGYEYGFSLSPAMKVWAATAQDMLSGTELCEYTYY